MALHTLEVLTFVLSTGRLAFLAGARDADEVADAVFARVSAPLAQRLAAEFVAIEVLMVTAQAEG